MSKIKVEKVIYHGKGHALKWRDIKHLELKDDDVIRNGLMMIILIIKDIG
jgi:hypothetical protein